MRYLNLTLILLTTLSLQSCAQSQSEEIIAAVERLFKYTPDKYALSIISTTDLDINVNRDLCMKYSTADKIAWVEVEHLGSGYRWRVQLERGKKDDVWKKTLDQLIKEKSDLDQTINTLESLLGK